MKCPDNRKLIEKVWVTELIPFLFKKALPLPLIVLVIKIYINHEKDVVPHLDKLNTCMTCKTYMDLTGMEI